MTPTTTLPTIAFWSPIPPQPSGIADYSAELLQHLVEHAHIDLFVDDGVTPDPGLPQRVAVCRAADYERRLLRTSYAAHIYQMGNHITYHKGIYKRLLRQPGITVLHDLYLGSFYRGLFTGREQALLEEVAYNYGLDTRALAEERIGRDVSADDFEIALVRRVVEASLAVVVHSEWARQTLQVRYPHKPIIFIPQGARVVHGDGRMWRARHGLSVDQVVFGAFSGMSSIKRLHVVVEAFRRFHLAYPGARLVLAGRADHATYVGELKASVAATNLKKAVIFAGDMPMDDFIEGMLACDVIINLRWPTAGETSASMMHAFGAGKVVITSDVPQFREFPDTFCWRVSVDGSEEMEQLLRCFERAAQHRGETKAAGERARQYVEEHSGWDIVARRYAAVLPELPGWRDTWLPAVPRRASGVNMVSDFRLDAGLGEAALGLLKTLVQRGLPVSHIAVTYQMAQRATDPVPAFVSALPRGNLYPLNLLTLNFHEVTAQPPDRLRAVLAGRYTIANWFWELPEIPAHLVPAFAYVDEIWVPSTHTQVSMQSVFKGPVRVIPVPVEVTTSPLVDRARFGLPSERFIFLFSFSASSCHARKNPFGLIEAFEKAFGRSRANGPLLVIRAHHLGKYAELQTALHQAANQVGATILEAPYTRQQMNDLLACADAHVSLHRAEGFGLSIAESMYLGKPVIATNYSGNADWMTAGNSYPVEYVLRPITEDDHRYQPSCSGTYQPGQWWAEPDLDQAVSLMRHVYANQAEARERGRQAALDIRRYCSPAVVGKMIEERLVAIEAQANSSQVAAGSLTTLSQGTAATVFDGSPREPAIPSLGDPANALLSLYRQSLRDWLAIVDIGDDLPFKRVPLLRRLVRVPALSRMLRMGKRLRWLGLLSSKQMALHSAAHETAEMLVRSVTATNTVIGSLQATVTQDLIVGLEQIRSDTATLRHSLLRLEAEVRELASQATRLNAESAGRQEMVESMQKQVAAAEELSALEKAAGTVLNQQLQ